MKMFWLFSKKNSFNFNRGLIGLDIVCLILKVFFFNGDFRFVKCGEVMDIKVCVFCFVMKFIFIVLLKVKYLIKKM